MDFTLQFLALIRLGQSPTRLQHLAHLGLEQRVGGIDVLTEKRVVFADWLFFAKFALRRFLIRLVLVRQVLVRCFLHTDVFYQTTRIISLENGPGYKHIIITLNGIIFRIILTQQLPVIILFIGHPLTCIQGQIRLKVHHRVLSLLISLRHRIIVPGYGFLVDASNVLGVCELVLTLHGYAELVVWVHMLEFAYRLVGHAEHIVGRVLVDAAD